MIFKRLKYELGRAGFRIVWRKRRAVRRKGNRKEYLAHKESARKLVHERLEYFNRFYGFKYNKVSIRNQKTRWGSCSRHGNLNFSYKLALLWNNPSSTESPRGELARGEPVESVEGRRMVDYIIVHELCHLQEFNHSHTFWALVAQQFPDYKSVIKKLKNVGSVNLS